MAEGTKMGPEDQDVRPRGNGQGRKRHHLFQEEAEQTDGDSRGQNAGRGERDHEIEDGIDDGNPEDRAVPQSQEQNSRKRGFSCLGGKGHRRLSKGCHQTCQRGGRQGWEGPVGSEAERSLPVRAQDR